MFFVFLSNVFYVKFYFSLSLSIFLFLIKK